MLITSNFVIDILLSSGQLCDVNYQIYDHNKYILKFIINIGWSTNIWFLVLLKI